MERGKAPKQFLSAFRDAEQHLAAIVSAAVALDQTGTRQAVGQSDGGVVLHAQALSDGANRRSPTCRKTFQREQQLVLLRFDPVLARCPLAEAQEITNLVTKLGQGPIVLGTQLGNGAFGDGRSTRHARHS